MKNYKFLNRSELHKIINRDISEYIFDYNEDLDIQEIKSAEITERTMNIKLKRFPKISFPKNTNTPDFATLKYAVALEIKSTKSIKNGFDNAFKQAKRQFKIIDKNIDKMVLVNVDNIPANISNSKIIETGVEISKKRKIEFFLIQRDNEVIYGKLP